MINKLSLRNEYKNVTNGLKKDIKSDHSYCADDVFNVVVDAVNILVTSMKQERSKLEKRYGKYITELHYPNYYYDRNGVFSSLEGFNLFYYYDHTSLKDLNKTDNPTSKTLIAIASMFKILKKSYMKYFVQTGLIRMWMQSTDDSDNCYDETKLGKAVFNQPFICLDRYFRNNVYEDYVTYVPKTDVIAPIFKELSKFVAFHQAPKYVDVDASLGLGFTYELSKIKRYNQFTLRNKGDYVNVNALQFITMIMIIITDFLNYCEPDNKKKNDKALHDLMVSWLKACNAAHLAFEFCDKQPEKN